MTIPKEQTRTCTSWRCQFFRPAAIWLVSLLFVAPIVSAQVAYQFERIYPVLQQPWYFSLLEGVDVGPDDHIYVVDAGANRVQKFNESGRLVDSWQSPTRLIGSIAIDSKGFVYVGATGGTEKYSAEGEFVLSFGREGAITIDDSDVLYEISSVISRYTPPADGLDSSPHEFDLSFGAVGSDPGEYRSVESITTDRDGAFYIADSVLNLVHKFLPDGTFDTRFGGFGNGPGQFPLFNPRALGVSDANEVYAFGGNGGMQVFDTNGGFLRTVMVDGGLEELDFDQAGNIVANVQYKAVAKFDQQGSEFFRWQASSDAPEKFSSVNGALQDSSGFVYVASGASVKKFTTDFEYLTSFCQFCSDLSIAVGDNDRLFVYTHSNVFVYAPPVSGLATDPHELEDTWDINAVTRRFIVNGNVGTDTLTEVPFDFRSPIDLGNLSADAGTTYALTVGDVNGDFAPDIAASRDGVNRLYINTDGHAFAPGINLGAESETTRDGVFVDIDSDGTLEFVVANEGATNRIYNNDGAGNFSLGGSVGASSDASQVVIAGDVDGRNGPDLFFGNLGVNRLFLNDGNGVFTLDSGFPGGTAQTYGAVFADLDNDNDLDLVLANDGVNQVLRNNGNGTFAAPENLTDDVHDSRDVDVFDQEFDRRVDIVVANFNQINRLYFNEGDGSFTGVDVDDRVEPTTSVDTVGAEFPQLRVIFGNLGEANVYYEQGLSINNQEVEFGGPASMTWDVVGDLFGVLAPGKVQQSFGQISMRIGPSGLVYLTDDTNASVYRYRQDGTFVGTSPTREVPGQYRIRPSAIALDRDDNLYITGGPNNFLSKYAAPADVFSSAPHVFEREIGEGELVIRTGVAVNGENEVLLIENLQEIATYDTNLQRIGTTGSRGFGPGFFENANDLDVAADGRLYVSESGFSRLQVFTPDAAVADNARAIVVAGGGPYPGNALWDATQLNASFAYRVLVSQGYSAESIQYLSDNGDLDLSGNGVFDVDAPANIANLQAAISGFASGAGSLVVYLVDHGGLDNFRMSGDEVLDAQTLGGWLDDWQANHPGIELTVIYDACQSGSFMDELRPPAGSERVVIASSQADQNAYFVSQGSLSFSNQFWTHVFNGLSLGDAFVLARDSQQATFVQQTALLDADADGNFSTPADLARVTNRFIGNGTLLNGEGPTIGSTSTDQTISNGASATLRAVDVIDTDGVARVWAVLRPPAFNPAAVDNPVQGLPVVDLSRVGDTDTYEADHSGFVAEGTYQATIYAEDAVGNRAIPQVSFVTVNNPLRRRAVIVAGGDVSSARFQAHSRNAQRAYRALVEQGYGAAGETCAGSVSLCDNACDNVCYLSNDGIPGQDTAPTLTNLADAVTSWGVDNTQDLTVYLVASQSPGGFVLGGSEVLSAPALKGFVDTAQQTLGGTVTVIVEGDDGRSFIEQLAPPTGFQRILISSTGTNEEAAFLSEGRVTFSKFFWNQVLNGADVRQAFRLARSAMGFRTGSPMAQLDDDGNAMPNQFTDGLFAARYALGSGVLLAGDDPIVSSLTISQSLIGSFEPISSTVTSTGTIERVESFVTRPDGNVVIQPLGIKSDGRYSDFSYGLCAEPGVYEVAIYATDEDGNTSLPLTRSVSRTTACDEFMFFSGFE